MINTKIKAGEIYWIAQPIPESLSTDTVKITIMRLSDGYKWNFTTLIFENAANVGAMTFIEDINWKQSFTPSSTGTYFVTIEDETLDVKHSQVLEALIDVAPIVTVAAITDTTAAAMLIAVNNAIAARLNGGAVQSYTIGGRNIQYMTLSELRTLRKELQAEISNTSSSGGRTYASFDR